MKNIFYLGGLFIAELSMRQSFAENGYQLLFPVSASYLNSYGKMPIFSACPLKHYGLINVVDHEKQLKNAMVRYKASMVIHRYYRHEGWMHKSAYDVCKEMGIPYIVYRMETWPIEDPIEVPPCDLFLYAHKCDEPFIKSRRTPVYYYPYGVSSFDKYDHGIKKEFDIAMFGFCRSSLQSRCDNLLIYQKAVLKLNKKIDVFWSEAEIKTYLRSVPKETIITKIDAGFNDERGHPVMIPKAVQYPGPLYAESLNYNKQFPVVEQARYINKSKVVISIDTVPFLGNGFSYKMWQSMGCGIPTITSYKEGVEDHFGPNGENAFYVKDEVEASVIIDKLLKSDSLKAEVGQRAHAYMNEKYNWFQRFDEIMKKENIWK